MMNCAPGGKRGRGKPRENWPEIIREDLQGLGLMWEDAFKPVEGRDGWRKCIARCTALHGMD